MMATYPALTVWQPWASLIAASAKPWEFRGHAAPANLVGKRIAIHAGARLMVRREVQELRERLAGDDHALTGLRAGPALDLLKVAARAFYDGGPLVLPLSAVVCIATLGQPVRGTELSQHLGLTHDSDRDEHSNWGWPLADIEAVPGPHPVVKGKQGWWTWQDHRA